MINLSLQKYFDAWRLVRSSNIDLTDEQKLVLHTYGNAADMDAIGRLVIQRKKIKYATNDVHARQIKSLYDAYNKISDHNPLDYVKKPPIKKITIDLADGQKIVISDKTLIWNICYHGFKFFKYFYTTYIKRTHNPLARRKGRGVNLQTSNVALAKQIIKYLGEKTSLNKNEIGNAVIVIFKSVGNPLSYKDGKTAYDSITRAR